MTRPNPEVCDLFEAGRKLRAPEGDRERLRERVMRRVGIGALAAGSVLSVTAVSKSGAAATGAAKTTVMLWASWIGVGAITLAAGAAWLGASRDRGDAGARTPSAIKSP